MRLSEAVGFKFFAGPDGFDRSYYHELRVVECIDVPVPLRHRTVEELAAENDSFLRKSRNLFLEEIVNPLSVISRLWSRMMVIACEFDEPYSYTQSGDTVLSVVADLRPGVFVQLATRRPVIDQIDIIVPFGQASDWRPDDPFKSSWRWLATTDLDRLREEHAEP